MEILSSFDNLSIYLFIFTTDDKRRIETLIFLIELMNKKSSLCAGSLSLMASHSQKHNIKPHIMKKAILTVYLANLSVRMFSSLMRSWTDVSDYIIVYVSEKQKYRLTRRCQEQSRFLQ